MPTVSFAQQGEDVVLWRALRHRPPGFFIDVGAHHPVGSSVTKIFSNAGWRGVNIEPLASLIPLFDEDRPNDINLAVGISHEAGELAFFDVVDDQQRSTFNTDLGEMYRTEGYRIEERSIPVIPLSEVFDKYVTGSVDFLKIDAEGHEESVLRSLDLNMQRPHIVLAEGALGTDSSWLSHLERARYRRALFDGVNYFCVAEEHWAELGGALSYPACSLDDYETYDHLLEVNALRAERDAAISEAAGLRDRMTEIEAQAARQALPARRIWRRSSTF